MFDLEGQLAALDAPGAEGPREPEPRAPMGAAEGGGRGGGVTRDGHVEVGDGASEQRVAHPAPDGPGAIAEGRERGHQRVERRRHPRGTRGTRGPTAQVTS